LRIAGVSIEVWLAAAAGLFAVAGIGVWLWRRRPRDPLEVERNRRAHLSRVGRIVAAEILEINEVAPEGNGASAPAPGGHSKKAGGARAGQSLSSTPRSVVFYTYTISGVTYETAQDVTGLEERACLKQLIAGQPASVKYDPANPGNSILVADDWSGLN